MLKCQKKGLEMPKMAFEFYEKDPCRGFKNYAKGN